MKCAYIVDDDPGFRGSLKMLLEVNGWRVEEFDSARAFLDRSRELDPGLLLLDMHMPEKSGLELLESAGPELERFAVVVVTGAGQVETAVRTMKAGAIDFIEKTLAPDAMVERLSMLELELQDSIRGKRDRLAAREKIDSLSPRERDVLERLLSGASNKLIGRALDLSPRTVEMHRAKMLDRLDVATTAQALEIARRAGVAAVAAPEPGD